uniref:Uncharacterized protein n=1 Tax=viral metagenome TaxID=1070528 RepID=A0A6C0F3W9_9ZZZZ
MVQKIPGVNKTPYPAKRAAQATVQVAGETQAESACVQATVQAALASLAIAQAGLKAAAPNSPEAQAFSAQVKSFKAEAANAITTCAIAAKNSPFYQHTTGNDSGNYAPCYPARCNRCREHDPTRNSGVAKSCLSEAFDYECCYDINNKPISCAGLGYGP